MPLTKKDLSQIKGTVIDAVEPFFGAIQKDFNSVAENFTIVKRRFDKVDEKLEEGVKEPRELLAIK